MIGTTGSKWGTREKSRAARREQAWDGSTVRFRSTNPLTKQRFRRLLCLWWSKCWVYPYHWSAESGSSMIVVDVSLSRRRKEPLCQREVQRGE